MRTYLLSLTDSDHKELKVTAAKLGVSVRAFILAAISFYLDSLEED